MNRILIVEDDKSISDAVALNMQFVGYEYKVFDDGKKAAEHLTEDHAFDLALLDIMLPGIDGFELFGYLERYHIPVIYMTAKTDSASEIRGLRDGAEDYIVKPFDMLTLMVRMEKVLKRTGKLNTIYRIKNIEIVQPVIETEEEETELTQDPAFQWWVVILVGFAIIAIIIAVMITTKALRSEKLN